MATDADTMKLAFPVGKEVYSAEKIEPYGEGYGVKIGGKGVVVESDPNHPEGWVAVRWCNPGENSITTYIHPSKLWTERRRVFDRPGYQLSMGAIPEHEDERPPEQIVRGRCPECGEALVANLYYHEERGYYLQYSCWNALLPDDLAQCNFYAVP